MIKCGSCKGRHETVAEIRACYSQPSGRRDGGAPNLTETYDRETARRQAVAATRPRSGGGGMIQTGPNGILAQLQRSARPATLEDSRNVALQRETFSQYEDFDRFDGEIQSRERAEDQQAAHHKLNRDGFSGGNKHGAPVPTKSATTGFPKVDPGHYAIERDGVVKFYKVDNGKEGSRWAGYVFLSVQASDDFHPIKNRDMKQNILQAIANDPQEAMTRYGREIGRCGHCHRTLTDEESRSRGIGPICAGKLGW